MNTDRLRREFPWMNLPGDRFLSRRRFGWLALGVVAFTIYGSFVPFHFHGRPWDDAVTAFQWVIEHRSNVQSRSDFLANFALGLPLGFCVLAWRLLDRNPSRLNVAGCVVALWPCCVLLAIFVEFGQLYFPGRTSSGSDILAQSLGSAVGMAVYVVGGQRLIHGFRRLFDDDRYRTPARGLLVSYVLVLALTQLLPLDLSASPADWYHKYRDGKLTLVPFAELGKADVLAWRKGQAWLELAAVYFPVGLLLAFVPVANPSGRPAAAAVRTFGLGLLLAVMLEAAQILVQARATSVTDVLIGGGAVLLGWLIARGMGTTAEGGGLDAEAALILGQAWLLWLAVAAWLPLDFDAALGGRVGSLSWLPFETALEKNYLSGLEEIVTKVLLFVPLGVVAAAYGRPTVKRGRIAAAVLLAVGVGGLLEAGQLFLPDRVASPMDVLYAAAGGWIGAAAAAELRKSLAEKPAEPRPFAADELQKLAVS